MSFLERGVSVVRPHRPQQRWQIIVDQPRAGAEHMRVDEALAREPMLAVRVFSWWPAISTGYKQAWPAWMDAGACAAYGIETAERPTGGGLAFHGSDVSLAVVVPRDSQVPLEALITAVCRSAARLCRSYGAAASTVGHVSAASPVTYCLTERSSYAVMIGALKVAGFALRRYPTSWLIQGSMLVQPLSRALQSVLPQELIEDVAARAIPLAHAAQEALTLQSVMARWAAHWTQWWELSYAM